METLLFLAIQLVNVPLIVVGWFLCLSPRLARVSWLWWNDEDGSGPGNTWWQKYKWLAWRNPVNNYRYVKRWLWTSIPVSKIGRDLWRPTWGAPNFYGKKGWYFQAGWNSSGFPVLSGGRNVNPY